MSDRRGANGGLESPASTAASGAAVLHWGSDRSASRPGPAAPRRSRRGSRDGSPRCGCSRGAERTEAGAITPPDRARPVCRSTGGRSSAPAQPEVERAFHRRRARAAPALVDPVATGVWEGAGAAGAGSRLGLRSALGKQAQRVEVAVRLSRDSDSEVDVRLVMLDLSARADGADALTLLDRSADPDAHGRDG